MENSILLSFPMNDDRKRERERAILGVGSFPNSQMNGLALMRENYFSSFRQHFTDNIHQQIFITDTTMSTVNARCEAVNVVSTFFAIANKPRSTFTDPEFRRVRVNIQTYAFDNAFH